MYNWEKSLREERSRKKTRNPSFSSSLLDEICRSIDDGGDQKSEELKFHKERASKKQSNGDYTNFKSKTITIEDEEMIRLRRARLIEKWIDKKVNEKAISNKKPQSLHELYKISQLDNDPLFFSSSSSSSDSSFGGFSSSETEAPRRPKPIRTNVSASSSEKTTKVSSFYEHNEFLMFDDYSNHHHHHHRQNHDDIKNEEVIIKSKSRALKIYANLKKVKQPISPGGRITSFINSLFTHGNAKKTKNSSYDDLSFERKSSKSSTQASTTCSSASSYYRSCLSKTSANSREKENNGVKRTVRFYPVTVIVDEDSRPCGQKCTYQEDCKKSESKVDEPARYFLNQNRNENEFMVHHDDDDYDDDDATSDTSSDLFELDHLAFVGANKYCKELPVYETTHFNRNLAIANGLIR